MLEDSVDGKPLQILFHDTKGHKDFDRLRRLSYLEVDIMLICFAVDNPASLQKVIDRWYPEVRHFCSDPPVPLVLVACKADMRGGGSSERGTSQVTTPGLISSQDAIAVANEIGAVDYLECSAKERTGIEELIPKAFAVVARCEPPSPRPRKRECVVT